MLDLKIMGGLVLDGTGGPGAVADVGVTGESISDVGDLGQAEARRTIRADGMIVCPGFIDAHSHSDTYLLIEPSAPSKIFQGVTTEVLGNCGVSAAPVTGPDMLPSDWRARSYPRQWRTMAEYVALLREARPAPNALVLVGHGKVRACVMGYDARPPTADEMIRMVRLLEQCLDEGAQGLSTGLIYAPGMFAEPDEIRELTRPVGARGLVYASHMRSESRRLLEAVAETLDVGRTTDARIQISHIKTAGKSTWKLADLALDAIEAARAKGIRACADRYPYTGSHTDLDTILPAWAMEGGRPSVLARLRDARTRDRLKREISELRSDFDWSQVTVASTHHPDNRRFNGKPLVEIASTLGLDPIETALRLIDTDELMTSAFFFGMCEENMWKFLAKPFVMIGSDASVRSPTGPLSEDHPHPRAYGAFPRFLRASLDGRTVPLSEAVRKMTSLPADQFGLKDRGVIAKGKAADIVVFDPALVRDTATYSTPHRLAQGMRAVIVNGALTLDEHGLTGARAGAVLNAR